MTAAFGLIAVAPVSAPSFPGLEMNLRISHVVFAAILLATQANGQTARLGLTDAELRTIANNLPAYAR